MDRLVDHLFVFEGNGIIKDFPGNYSQYRLSLENSDDKMQSAAGIETDRKQTILKKKVQLSYKDKREFDLLEKEIADLTLERETITRKFNEGNLSFEELQQLSQRIGEISDLLDTKELRWLELSETMDKI
jgi:ATP-binding cassette subfamily F protein uup